MERLDVLVAQAEREGQVGAELPVILHVGRVVHVAEVRVVAAEAPRGGVREPEQEIGQVVSGARDRKPVGILGARFEAGEIERAPRVRIAERIALAPAPVPAERDAVLLADLRQAGGGGEDLVAVEGGAPELQSAVVGEQQVRHAVADRLARDPGDAELPRDVVLICEGVGAQRADAVEVDPVIEDQLRLEAEHATEPGVLQPARPVRVEPGEDLARDRITVAEAVVGVAAVAPR